MADVIGRGVIEVSADSSKLNAAIDKARRSIKDLGETDQKTAGKRSASIDAYIRKLQQQNAQLGMSAKQAEFYRLGLRGATDEQLRAVNAAMRVNDAYQRNQRVLAGVRAGLITIGTAAVTGLIAAAVAFDHLIKKAGDFQDMAEKTGDSAENIASLAVAAGTAGVEMDAVVAASIKLNKNLTGVDDESSAAGAAIKALGLDLKTLKQQSPADQIETIAKALNQFEDSAAKGAVAEAAMGKGAAQLLPFLKELGQEGGRQVILTNEQIRQADEYADKQAKLRTELSLHAQAIATEMLPALTRATQAIADLAKEQQITTAISKVFNVAMSVGARAIKFFALDVATVAYVFSNLSTRVGGLIEQFIALQNLDITKFNAISAAVDADIAKAAADYKGFLSRTLGVGQAQELTQSDANYSHEGRNAPPPKKKLVFDGKLKDSAAEIAKAKLASDLEDIRRASDAIVNIFSNSEKILEARHAASLINDREYYDAKAAFLRLNADEQERGLKEEIKRLQAEKLVGKERIENERKIADARGKLAKVREDAAANTDILTIQDEDAARKVIQNYLDAADAAQAYIDTIHRQNAAEVASIGRGAKFRQQQGELARIEDKFIQRRQELEGDLRRKQVTPEQFQIYLAIAQDTYQREVEAFTDRSAKIEAAQANGLNGMTEALHNYADVARDVAGMTETVFTNAMQGLEDSFVDLATTGKLTFKDLLNSIHADLIRMGFRIALGSVADSVASAIKPNSGGITDFLGKFGGSISGSNGAQTAQTAALTTNAATLTNHTAALDLSMYSLRLLATAADSAASSLSATAATAGVSAGAGGSDGIGSLFNMALGAFGGSSVAVSAPYEYASYLPDILRGGRAIGGPVSSGGLYRVNEKNQPELLSVAGKQYLMMGDQGGAVTTQAAGGGGDTYHLTVQVAPPVGASRDTALQFGAAAGRQIQHAMRRNG